MRGRYTPEIGRNQRNDRRNADHNAEDRSERSASDCAQMLLTDIADAFDKHASAPSEKRLISFFMRRSPPPLRSARRQ